MTLTEMDRLLDAYQVMQQTEKWVYGNPTSTESERSDTSRRVDALARRIANVLVAGKDYV